MLAAVCTVLFACYMYIVLLRSFGRLNAYSVVRLGKKMAC